GHKVRIVLEKASNTVHTMEADLVFFNTWNNVKEMRKVNAKKVFWCFDQIESNEGSLLHRDSWRKDWMAAVLPEVTMGFCTDGDWVVNCPNIHKDKLRWLPQAADQRIIGRGIASDFDTGTGIVE